MSSEAEKKNRSLKDYEELLLLLAQKGVPSVVIGGCAVGAYAHQVGETVLSGDLDLYASPYATRRILAYAVHDGADVFRRPRPRAPQVTMFNWKEKEVNVISASVGFSGPEMEILMAREFPVASNPELPILIADPFHLMANKVSINRPKDRPHIEVLRRFLEEEVVDAFASAVDPRERISPAQRLLAATRKSTLDEKLVARILPLLRTEADFRFLVHHAPSAALADEVVARADVPELREQLGAIRRRRRFR